MNDIEDVVDVEGGRVTLQYLSAGHVLATSGKDVGWLSVDGKPRYAARRFALEDGSWVPSDKHHVCYEVDPDLSRILDVSSPDAVRAKASGILLEAVVGWHESRPDRAAEARVQQAADRLRRHDDELRMVERRLADLRAATPGLESELAEARDSLASLQPNPDGVPSFA